MISTKNIIFLFYFNLQIVGLWPQYSDNLLGPSLINIINLPGWSVCHSDGDVIMMLPVTRFKGQPVGMVTTTTPWLSVGIDPTPQCLWLASWSAATYQATPPLVFYPPAVWIPEHAHLMQVRHLNVSPVLYLTFVLHQPFLQLICCVQVGFIYTPLIIKHNIMGKVQIPAANNHSTAHQTQTRFT